MARRKDSSLRSAPPAAASLTLADFRAANNYQRERCSLTDLYDRVSTDDAATIREAIANEGIQATAIQKVLREKYGWPSGEQVISRHRRKVCLSCAPRVVEK